MDYIPVPKNHETAIGDTYRITFKVRASYDARTINKIIGLLKTGAGLVDISPFHTMTGYWVIGEVTAYSPNWVNGTPMTSQGQWEEWDLIVNATRIGSGTPLLVAVGWILGCLVVFGAVVLVLGWTAEKVNKGPLGTAIQTILSPAVLLAAFIVTLIVLKKGGRA